MYCMYKWNQFNSIHTIHNWMYGWNVGMCLCFNVFQFLLRCYVCMYVTYIHTFITYPLIETDWQMFGDKLSYNNNNYLLLLYDTIDDNKRLQKKRKNFCLLVVCFLLLLLFGTDVCNNNNNNNNKPISSMCVCVCLCLHLTVSRELWLAIIMKTNKNTLSLQKNL